MKILHIQRESEFVCVVETGVGKFKYRKTKAGFRTKGSDFAYRIWSYAQGNWLSNEEIEELELPAPEEIFEKEADDEQSSV